MMVTAANNDGVVVAMGVETAVLLLLHCRRHHPCRHSSRTLTQITCRQCVEDNGAGGRASNNGKGTNRGAVDRVAVQYPTILASHLSPKYWQSHKVFWGRCLWKYADIFEGVQARQQKRSVFWSSRSCLRKRPTEPQRRPERPKQVSTQILL